MRKSRIYLPDINVWLAVATQRHAHFSICVDWLNSVDSAEVVFCRVSQMGFLRLLTTEAVMGVDVLSSRDAWRAYQAILEDARISFAPEPFDLEKSWHEATSQNKPTPKVWTDAYLAAFAESAGMKLVTLDKAMSLIAEDALLLN